MSRRIRKVMLILRVDNIKILPPDNHINNSLTPDYNPSLISGGQENDNKLNEPATPDYVSKLSD